MFIKLYVPHFAMQTVEALHPSPIKLCSLSVAHVSHMFARNVYTFIYIIHRMQLQAGNFFECYSCIRKFLYKYFLNTKLNQPKEYFLHLYCLSKVGISLYEYDSWNTSFTIAKVPLVVTEKCYCSLWACKAKP